jgi:hypothetical protein
MCLARRALLTAITVGVIAAGVAQARNRFMPLGGGPRFGSDIASVSFGTPFKYNSNYPSQYINADGYFNTWADDGNIYANGNDSSGWQGASDSNLSVNLLNGFRTSLTGSLVNAMAPWGVIGQSGSDGDNYKTSGLISVHGTLILSAVRVHYPNSGNGWQQPTLSAQLVKSTDHGVTWSPQPPSRAQPYALPMFGATFGSPTFVQYGQDYIGQSQDLSNLYVYAVSSNANWSNAGALYLGRCLIANIANLSGSDWSFYQGGDGTMNTNWGAIGSAAAIITNAGKISNTAIQYLPAFGRYIAIEWFYPSVNAVPPTLDTSTTEWDVWQAPHPWGPWSELSTTTPWNPLGLYIAAIISKSVSVDGGRTLMIATTGDYNMQNPGTGDYTLILVPATLN